MFRPSTLIVALLFCGPTLWQALVTQSTSWDEVGIRFLIALPVAGILVGLVRLAFGQSRSAGSSDSDAGARAG